MSRKLRVLVLAGLGMLVVLGAWVAGAASGKVLDIKSVLEGNRDPGGGKGGGP